MRAGIATPPFLVCGEGFPGRFVFFCCCCCLGVCAGFAEWPGYLIFVCWWIAANLFPLISSFMERKDGKMEGRMSTGPRVLPSFAVCVVGWRC